jgi:hypothetical protein
MGDVLKHALLKERVKPAIDVSLPEEARLKKVD